MRDNERGGRVQFSFQTSAETRARIKRHYADTGEPGARLVNRLLDEYFGGTGDDARVQLPKPATGRGDE